MNQLSWLIYWGGTASSLRDFLQFFGFMTLIAGLGFTALSKFDWKREEWVEDPVRWYKLPIGLGFCMMLAGNLIPPKETFYAIAASEVGERVLHSSTGNKAVEALNAWLDKQIRESMPLDLKAPQPTGSPDA